MFWTLRGQTPQIQFSSGGPFRVLVANQNSNYRRKGMTQMVTYVQIWTKSIEGQLLHDIIAETNRSNEELGKEMEGPVHCYNRPFDIMEVKRAIFDAKNKKAPGLDDLYTIFFKMDCP